MLFIVCCLTFVVCCLLQLFVVCWLFGCVLCLVCCLCLLVVDCLSCLDCCVFVCRPLLMMFVYCASLFGFVVCCWLLFGI